ncbi:Hpt domain-containing protein [Polaribacter sp.]|uniref:Hpt domain-containing protein n=1 Tax=Polaribacter sp. TaxID=1920175 RepID=UPI003F6ABEB6
MNLPPNANSSQIKSYNLQDVDTMCRGNKDSIFKMIEVFIDQIPKFIEELNTAFSDNDVSKIKNEVHKIKPTVHFFGAFNLKEQLLVIDEKTVDELGEIDLKHTVKNINLYASEVINELKNDYKIN